MILTKPILIVDLQRIKANYITLCNLSTSPVAGMVKADGYGLGAERISEILEDSGCKVFYVASLEEGISLRKTIEHSNIYVLEGIITTSQACEYEHYNLTPILNHLGQIELWQNYARKKDHILPAVLNVETGVNRLAISISEWQHLLDNLDLLNCLKIEYIISHLACSDDMDEKYNHYQLKLFKDYLNKWPFFVYASLANSGGILLGQEFHFDLTRPGALLYGLEVNNSCSNLFVNTIRLMAPIVQVKSIARGSFIGYGKSYYANENILVATVLIGYADGYSRLFSNKGEVMIDSYCAPVIGRVSMDLINIDVSKIPSHLLFTGQAVDLINDKLNFNYLSSKIGAFNYEMLSYLNLNSRRYNRVYKD